LSIRLDAFRVHGHIHHLRPAECNLVELDGLCEIPHSQNNQREAHMYAVLLGRAGAAKLATAPEHNYSTRLGDPAK
jgi:hypothetical protein